MCKLKSAIVLKDRIFMPDYDSHDMMLKELGIEDDYFNANNTFVRVELSPEYGDPFTDIDKWKFVVDQDFKPDWFDRDEAKKMMKKQVKEWAKTHIFYDIEGLTVSSGKNIYIKNCKKVRITDDAKVKLIDGNTLISDICENATVDCIYGDTIISCISDNVRVDRIGDNAMITRISDNTKVDGIGGNTKIGCICDNATVNCIYDNALISNLCDNAKVSNLFGNAIVDCFYGNATIDGVYCTATISNIYDSATIDHIYNNARITNIHGHAKIKSMFGNAYICNIYENARIDNVSGSALVRTHQNFAWEEVKNCKVEQSGMIIDRVYNKIIVDKYCNLSVSRQRSNI